MDWIKEYQLFLFDFDGLLVNTEKIHFEAYRLMCKAYGFDLNWDFPTYTKVAHYTSDGLKNQIYLAIPDLYKKEPNWDVLYAYKRAKVIELLESGQVELMPGVDSLLQELQKKQILTCVVTHSPKKLVDVIKNKHMILKTIPHWITREDYKQPKPHPEGYLLAIERYAKDQDKIIGFEDTPRGLAALKQTKAESILITSLEYKDLEEGQKVFASFETLNQANLLLR